jgi:pimeloyl-ACP methyl ester carboxylesterase
MLVFVHGMGFDEREWSTVVQYFTERNFDCNAVNLREGLNLRKACFQDYVNKLKDIITEEDIVIGHSMGGLIVQKVAEESTIKAGVGICSAPPKSIKFHMGVMAVVPALKYLPKIIMKKPVKPDFSLVKGMCHKYMGVGLDEEAVRDIYEQMVEESSIVIKELALHKIVVDEKKVNCPLLFIAMKDDRACPPEMVKKIAEKYNAEYKVYDGCHHFFNNENWREVVNGIEGFIVKVYEKK